MNKKVPLRMCVVCTEMKPKSECIRVVRVDDSTYLIDETGKMNGRGAYICKNVECICKCQKTKAFNRSFKHNVGDAIYEGVKEKGIE